GRPRPFHFDGDPWTWSFDQEVEAFFVAALRLLHARSLDFAIDLELLRQQDSEDRFVEKVLAKRLVHVAGREVAHIPREATLNSEQDAFDRLRQACLARSIGHRTLLQPPNRSRQL